jgi:thiol peroxidase
MSQQRNASVTLKGNPITLDGQEIKPGDAAPDFTAVDTGLQAVRLSDAKGKVIILSSVPSVDTPVCDTETRRFNKEASGLGDDVEIWTVSMDLPFAQKRWCAAAGVDRVKVMSDFRDRSFGRGYGVQIADGPLAGVNARAVFVVGRDGKIKHVEYVNEIASEPNYEAALSAAREAAQA